MSDNSWYENGELPPVGTVCEVLNKKLHMHDWEKCTILFMGKFKCVYDSESCHERIGDVNSTGLPVEFRPIKTDRELAIEAALKVFNVGPETDKLLFTMAGALFDAGLLRSKNES